MRCFRWPEAPSTRTQGYVSAGVPATVVELNEKPISRRSVRDLHDLNHNLLHHLIVGVLCECTFGIDLPQSEIPLLVVSIEFTFQKLRVLELRTISAVRSLLPLSTTTTRRAHFSRLSVRAIFVSSFKVRMTGVTRSRDDIVTLLGLSAYCQEAREPLSTPSNTWFAGSIACVAQRHAICLGDCATQPRTVSLAVRTPIPSGTANGVLPMNLSCIPSGRVSGQLSVRTSLLMTALGPPLYLFSLLSCASI